MPVADAEVVDVSRSRGTSGTRHLAADLSDPNDWPAVIADMERTLTERRPARALFLHCAATLQPIGPAHTVGRGAELDGYAHQVVLNSAAPQVLGAGFLSAVAAAPAPPRATLVVLSSGAAKSVYEGWSAYGAGKAAIDHWVRITGAEQARLERPVTVLAVAPGVVDTGMQDLIREQDAGAFPAVQRFIELHRDAELVAPEEAAASIWRVVGREDMTSGAVIDLRDLP